MAKDMLFLCLHRHCYCQMSHKKKDFDQLDSGKYGRDKLAEAVRDVLNCQKSSERAHKDSGIPLRTIQHHVK